MRYIFNIFLPGLVLCIFFSSYSQGSGLLHSNAPGNCFLLGDPVSIVLDSGDAGPGSGQFRVLDYDGEEVFLFQWGQCEVIGYKSFGWNVLSKDYGLQFEWNAASLGFYVAQFIPEGTEAVQDFLRFVVIPRRDDFGPSPFGMDAAFSWFIRDESDLRTACRLLKMAGVDWVRDRIAWGDVQPEPEKWNWTRYDMPIRVQKEEGLQVYQVFHDTALWAARNPEGNPGTKRYPPRNINDLSLFLSEASKRYEASVTAWEIWNEVDSAPFFAGAAEDYAPILQKAFRSIKSQLPSSRVLLGSMCFFQGTHIADGVLYEDREGERFLEKVFECDAGKSFDIYNFHYYGPADGLLDRYKVDREILARHGLQSKPVWLTEMGLPGDGPTTSAIQGFEREQVDYLIKTYTLAMSLGIEKVFYFIFPSFLEFGRSYWGIYDYGVSPGWSPKPSYFALALLTHTLKAANCLGRVEIDEAIRGILFRVAGKDVLIVWSRKPEGESIPIPIQGIYATDVMGRPIKVTGNSLAISRSPVYLTGKVRDIVKSGEFFETPRTKKFRQVRPRLSPLTLLLRCEPRHGAEEDRIVYQLQVYNETGQKQSGTLVYRMTGGEFGIDRPAHFELGPGEIFDGTFEQILWENPQGERMQSVSAILNGRIVAEAKCWLEWVNPVQIESAGLTPQIQGEGFLLEVKLENRSQRIQNPELRLEGIEFAERFRVDRLHRGEKRAVYFPIPDWVVAGECYTLRTGKEETEVYLDLPWIGRLQGVSRIDGAPDPEDGLARWHLWKRAQCTQSEAIWRGLDDLSGVVSLGLEGDCLYLAGEIRDDDFNPPLGADQPWTGDAVELFLDLRTKGLGDPDYGPGVFQLFLSPPSVEIPGGRIALWQPEVRDLEEVEFAFCDRAGGYAFEARIPLKAFGIDRLDSGRIIGCDVVLDDRDGLEGRHKQMAWRGTSENWRNPSVFARVRVE